MCGLFGAIGRKINVNIIRALAIANRDRGTDSLGFFDSGVNTLKLADDPFDGLVNKEFCTFLNRACAKRWFVAGHTRLGTMGKNITANAHPFLYGNYVGSHNGIVEIPKKSDYTVDSQYLIDLLNQHQGDYQKAFVDVPGYWGLTWTDCHGSLFLQAHDNTIHLGNASDGNWYYSSEKLHLMACLGSVSRLETIDSGRTLRFTGPGNFHEMPKFVSQAPAMVRKSFLPLHYGGGMSTTHGQDDGIVVKKFDDDLDMPDGDQWEMDYLDGLAAEAGYGSGVEFMRVENYHSVRRAIQALEWDAQ